MTSVKEWCLVTGVSSGLGRACLDVALDRGLGVIGIDIDQNELDHLSLQFPGCLFFNLDVREASGFDTLIDSLRIQGLKISIAVLAAGIGLKSPFLELTADQFIATIEVNLLARAAMCRTLFVYMSQSGGGRIVLISSSTALAPLHSFAAYSASNAAFLSFGRAWSVELRNTNIDLTTVVPSGMRTSFQRKAGVKSDKGHLLDPTFVAKKIFQSNRPIILVGRSARLTDLVNRLLPRSWVDTLLARAVSRFT